MGFIKALNKKAVLVLGFVALAVFAFAYQNSKPTNFAECILSEASRPMSGLAAEATVRVCRNKHPEGLSSETKGAGRGLIRYDNMYECIADKARYVENKPGQSAIAAACRHLYSG